MGEPQPTKCLRCGSTRLDRGKVYPKGVLWDIRFKSDHDHGLSLKQKVRALACLDCGHIELMLVYTGSK